MILQETPDMEADQVTGVALKNNVGRVTLTDLPERPDIQSRIARMEFRISKRSI